MSSAGSDVGSVGEPARRKFNVLLALGIFLLPIVFVWFLSRKGHSTTARIVGFAWTALVVLVALTGSPSSTSSPPTTPHQASTPATPLSPEEQAAIAAREEAERAAQRQREVRRSPERFLTLERVNGVRGGFDTVFLLSGAITNSSEVDIKDPTISCDLFGESGTRIGAVRETLLEIVPAGGTKRFTELNMGFMGSTQTANYRCEIIDAEAIP